jgi:hypothetical protein
MPTAVSPQELELLKDQKWRLNNLYFIVNEKSQKVQFKLRWHQQKLLDNLHALNIILKARQMGFSTFIAIYMPVWQKRPRGHCGRHTGQCAPASA